MILTVKKLLSMDIYKEAKVVGGVAGLKNEVSGITIMEDDTIGEWLRGGEALLTSLLPIKEYTEEGIVTFFDRLLPKKISAIIVKIGKAVDRTPDSLIAWGQENEVPIIEVPRHIFYTDLMYPVMAELIESQVNKLTYYKSVHEKFRELSLKSGSLKEIIETLSDIIDNPVEIYDRNLNLLSSTYEKAESKKLKKGQYSRNHTYMKRKIPGGEEIDQVVLEISALENTKSYLAILEINKKIDEMDLIAVENACTNISLQMVQNIAIKEVEERFMNDIINDLVFSAPKLNDSLMERANIAGIDLYGPHYVVLLELKEDLNIIKPKLKKQLALLVKKYNGAYSLKSDDVTLLLPYASQVEKSSFEELLKTDLASMSNALEKEFSKTCFSAGISSVHTGFENIKSGYKEAQAAADVGEELYGIGNILFYEELGLFRLISKLSQSSDVWEYIPQNIQKLRQIDQEENKELYKTLASYIQNNKHIKKTSEELYIHPKTVSYRLQQIKEITKIDFESADQLLEIQFAIKIIKFLEKEL